MAHTQNDILAPIPRVREFISLGLRPGADGVQALQKLQAMKGNQCVVLGIGEPLMRAVGREIPGLKTFVPVSGAGVTFPSTQSALWLSLGGDDAGEVLHRCRQWLACVDDFFHLDEEVACFRYDIGRDLSGYEDGTENPQGDKALQAAIVSGQGPGLDGGSFVAIQKWVHDLGRLEKMPPHARDHLVGRGHETNEELADAPASAHVKRAAQERFEPAAFMLRKSMPWGNAREHGLYFVAYGNSFSAFERVLHRMAGLDDGITDGLLQFSRAVSGGFYFCPPMQNGRYDLRALGL
ncbi:MAG: Dyp-type peroxidase [Myxococcaceae bacterium]|nr:Dyp-type peroxidase [Myxococcaceae bacterium]